MTLLNVDRVYTHCPPERNRLPDKARIGELEKRTNVTFPDHYRRYLLEYNGGYFSPPGPVIEGVEGEYPASTLETMYALQPKGSPEELGREDVLSLWDGNDPPILFPIGDTDTGFFIVLITEPGEDYGCLYLRTYHSPVYKTENESHFLAYDIDEFFGALALP